MDIQQILTIIIIQFSILSWGVEYVHFSERLKWLRDAFLVENNGQDKTLPSGEIIKTGDKIPNQYINRFCQELFTCKICFCKYTSFIAGFLIFVIGFYSTGFLVALFGVGLGIILSKLTK